MINRLALDRNDGITVTVTMKLTPPPGMTKRAVLREPPSSCMKIYKPRRFTAARLGAGFVFFVRAIDLADALLRLKMLNGR